MGQRSAKEVQGKPVVVVCGGGYGGTTVAQELDKDGKFNVVLIDRKDYFLHNVAALRATVQPEAWAKRILIPYDKTLKHGTIIQAEVSNITPAGVFVHGKDDPISFDYLVIATGSSYAFPCKVAEPHRTEAEAKYHRVGEIVSKATRVAVIGGGPSGVELCGEIRHRFPDKDVVLVHSQAELLPGPGSPALKAKLLEKLKSKGIRVLLNERVLLADELAATRKHTDDNFLAGQRTIKTQSGTTLDVDLIFFCTGLAINNQSFHGISGAVHESSGRLRVNEFLQVVGQQKVFALGDCANVERESAYFAGLQGAVVAKNITALSEGAELKPYVPGPIFGILVPIGPEDGASQLPMGDGKVVGGFTTKLIKSKDLFWEKYWKQLHVKPGTETTGEQADAAHVHNLNLAAALRITEAEAEQLRRSGMPLPEHEAGATHT